MSRIINKRNAGFTLVETLVAVLILTIGTIGPMTIASKGLQSSAFSLEQNAAYFLAQEGLELVANMRNTSAVERFNGGGGESIAWLINLNTGTGLCTDKGSEICLIGLDARGNGYNCNDENVDNCKLVFADDGGIGFYFHDPSALESDYSPYIRTIQIYEPSGETSEVRVTSKVEWESPLFGAKREVTLVTTLFNIYK